MTNTVWLFRREMLSWNAAGVHVVEILTRTDRPKPLPLLKEKNSNSKTSQATLTKPLNNISNMRLYKVAQQLQQRLMTRIAQ